MKIKILYFLILLITFSKTEGQTKLQKADDLYDNYEYIDAIKIYEKVAEKGFKSVELFEKLGNSYYFNGDLEKANNWYTALFDLNEKVEPEYYYRYSQTLKSVGNYQKADEMLNSFSKMDSSDSRARLYNENKNYLETIKKNSGRYSVDKLDINSELSDYGTSFNGNNFVFASNRNAGGPLTKVQESSRRDFTKLYSSAISEDGSLGKPKELPFSNESHSNESTPVFTKDGTTMYFTGNSFKNVSKSKDSKKIIRLKIFRATLKDGKWQDFRSLPFNSDDFSNAHPALSADEKTLYFASDRPGSKGQSDIYMVEVNNGRFGRNPVNLGNKINTEGKETFPSVSGDNELYFSSDGHPGLGGMDIFVSKISNGNFQDVENVGEPVNSTMDDFAFVIDSKSKVGYFSSNRSGGVGFDDIYKLKEIQELKYEQTVNGVITDSQSGKNLPGATVSLFDEDMKPLEELITDENGNYSFANLKAGTTYAVRAQKEDYLTKESIITLSNEEGKTDLPISLDAATIKIGEGSDFAKVFNIVIYFDLGKSDIRPDAAVQLASIVEVMKISPTIKVDVRSFTDSRASKEYNLILSEARAQATMKWIINEGIDPSRLTAKGYGESQLINKCSDGVDCTEEEHKLNRRSEFIIVKM